jgi:two-component system, chemotaxis family, chemotaxis protein CheY
MPGKKLTMCSFFGGSAMGNNEIRLSGKTVLIVDDSQDIRDAFTHILDYEGYIVATASNGQEAWDCLEKQRPDLILLDLMMPVLNGWDFASKLRERSEFSDIPVVILSASVSNTPDINKIGVNGFIKKPVDLENLLSTVNHFCYQRV